MYWSIEVRDLVQTSSGPQDLRAHLQRLAFLAVGNPVLGVVSVLLAQTVVHSVQMYSQGSGRSAQMDFWTARVI